MRLGSYDCELKDHSKAYKLYGEKIIHERHRHRLEVNNEFLDALVKKGLMVSGINRELNLVEVAELADHPFFIGCQYHPEFQSKPFKPHPLFPGFSKACAKIE